MKVVKLLLLCVICFSVFLNCEPSPTCPANLDGDWEGEFFPRIPKIKYDGPTSKNQLAYKWYNPNEEILGKNMKDRLRFSVAFWHTFRGARLSCLCIPATCMMMPPG
ncbi:putative xylose isomerase [Helianthus annuus]|nr:putative xylose isomerase [Helianthus annuus]